jgi:type II secretory pathway component GspD/PulD (secretin)
MRIPFRFVGSLALALLALSFAMPRDATAQEAPAPMEDDETEAPAADETQPDADAADAAAMEAAAAEIVAEDLAAGPAEPVPEPDEPEKPDPEEVRKKAILQAKLKLQKERALSKTKQREVRAFYWQAIKAYRDDRFRTTVQWCDRALAIDPESKVVQRLKFLAKRKLQDHRLGLEAEEDKFLDEEALAEVERENRFPQDLPRLPRPELLLREHTPKSEAMRRMEERLNQRVSMNFIDADLDYVLQTLFKISGVDILAEQSVVEEKTLTLHVENVPLKEILEFIKRNYEGIEYAVTENAVWLTSPEKPPLVPKAYPLSRGLVSQGSFATGVRTNRGGAGNNNNRNNRGRNLPNANQLQNMNPTQLNRMLSGMMGGQSGGTSAQQMAQAVAGGQGAGSESYLESVLKWVETWDTEWPLGSKWWLDRQTNTLMVLTTSSMHERIGELLDVMDTVPVQVLVRTKFIEVLSDDLKEYGVSDLNWIDWSDRVLPDMTPEAGGVSTSGMGSPDGGFSVFFNQYLSNSSALSATLSALEKKQRTRVLSAPQIIAMNNMPATIDISKTFSYASQYQTTTGTIVNDNQAVSVPNAMVPSQFEEIAVGFFLEMLPSVGRDRKNIVLDLRARVDEVVGNIEDFQNIPIIVPGSMDATDGSTPTLPSGGNSTQAVQRPVVDGREFQTRMVVEDGGTVVIGGLLKNYQEEIRRRVPILGQIPIIGWLFRYKKTSVKQSNLIIVVQAHIVSPSGQYYKKPKMRGKSDDDTKFGVQSFSARRVRPEWIEDVAPEVADDILKDTVEE